MGTAQCSGTPIDTMDIEPLGASHTLQILESLEWYLGCTCDNDNNNNDNNNGGGDGDEYSERRPEWRCVSV